jgi:uncharacterized protein YheU (UPF0270 family)
MDQYSKTPTPPVEVPMEQLSQEVLAALVESFVLREGTDYGAAEVSHGTKNQQVLRQLKNGQVKIVFDPDSESVTLMLAEDFRRLLGAT